VVATDQFNVPVAVNDWIVPLSLAITTFPDASIVGEVFVYCPARKPLLPKVVTGLPLVMFTAYRPRFEL
jgi:hypothetical protein